MQHMIGTCPICNNDLVATKLTCHNCGLELTNDFTIPSLALLGPSELHFIEQFLQCSGNLKEMQRELHLSYPACKKKLTHIQELLHLQESSPSRLTPDIIIGQLPVYQDDSAIVKACKLKLNEQNGLATISLPRGRQFQIYYEEYGSGLMATNIPRGRILTWKALESAMELLIQSGGRAPKGNAMKAKLGEPGLTLDTIEGYVAFHAYGVRPGESALRCISALAAIMEWCGLCNNSYGYVELRC